MKKLKKYLQNNSLTIDLRMVHHHLFPLLEGDNFHDFLFAFLEDEVFPKWSLLLKERICLMGANSFLYERTPIYMGGNNDNHRLASPESVPIHLNIKQILVKCFYFSIIMDNS